MTHGSFISLEASLADETYFGDSVPCAVFDATPASRPVGVSLPGVRCVGSPPLFLLLGVWEVPPVGAPGKGDGPS